MTIRFIVIYLFAIYSCISEKIPYMELEHITLAYSDPTYVANVFLSASRYTRKNLFYYVTIRGEVLKPIDNSVVLNFYVYEFLTNVYKRSFVDMSFKYCDFVEKDSFFAPSARRVANAAMLKCPLLPGKYSLDNMTTPRGPFLKQFPFKKGRIFLNATTHDKLIVSGYIDMEIKEVTAEKIKRY